MKNFQNFLHKWKKPVKNPKFSLLVKKTTSFLHFFLVFLIFFSFFSTMFKWLSLGCKKMPKNSEGAMKTSSSRASKWAPTCHSCMVAPKSLSGQPNPDLIQRLARKGFWSYHTAISRGGSFRSSGWTRFHGTLRILGHFFTTQTKPFEHCASL